VRKAGLFETLQVKDGSRRAMDQKGELSDGQLRLIREDVELHVNALRNAAYAHGMACTKASIVARVNGEWS
jgi:hypothetical protein